MGSVLDIQYLKHPKNRVSKSLMRHLQSQNVGPVKVPKRGLVDSLELIKIFQKLFYCVFDVTVPEVDSRGLRAYCNLWPNICRLILE